MAILYAQLINETNSKLISSNYSSEGFVIQDDYQILESVRDKIIDCKHSTFTNNKIYSESIKKGNYTYFLYISLRSPYLIAVLADKRSTCGTVEKYFNSLYKAISAYKVKNYNFDLELKELTNVFNKNENMIKSTIELKGVHTGMMENLDALIKRGNNIGELGTKAQSLRMRTQEMSNKAQSIKNKELMDQYKIYFILIVIFLILSWFFFFR